ncbi:hypothetical protein FB45DRAFT_56797 [Roridomyces roridus]|uniref:Uncharacterized protein n=1 Tax=Roridomyces roridus TaxID=1738132 RepID=A0AAD7FIY7_9AGAR|nr:hypothetical protein FB45DRAFT_56797 [Roridomyces roridus]
MEFLRTSSSPPFPQLPRSLLQKTTVPTSFSAAARVSNARPLLRKSFSSRLTITPISCSVKALSDSSSRTKSLRPSCLPPLIPLSSALRRDSLTLSSNRVAEVACSGVALSCEGTAIRVFGAEPSYEGADDATRGYYAGERVESVSSLTIADGLRTPVGIYPWQVIFEWKLVSGMYSVTETEIIAALRFKLVTYTRSGSSPWFLGLLETSPLSPSSFKLDCTVLSDTEISCVARATPSPVQGQRPRLQRPCPSVISTNPGILV